MAQCVVGGFDFHVAEPAVGIFQSVREQEQQFVFGQGPKFKDLGARNEWGIDEEKWIVRGRANEANDTAFNVGQKDILLRFIEAMDFVDEKYCGLAFVFESVGSSGEDAAHICDVRFNATETFEFIFGLSSDDLGEGCFAGARWAVENQRLNSVGFNGTTKELAGGENVGLTDEIVEVARTHSRGQGLVALELRLGFWLYFLWRSCSEQVIASHDKNIR
jgi:hypothetical protein